MSKVTQKAVFEILSNASAVTSLVNTKIYPTFVPQDTKFPAVIYRIVGKQPIDTKDGVYGSVDTLAIEIYDDEAVQCSDIGEAIRDTLDRYRGTVQSVQIDKIIFESQSDENFIPELALYNVSQQYRVRVKY